MICLQQHGQREPWLCAGVHISMFHKGKFQHTKKLEDCDTLLARDKGNRAVLHQIIKTNFLLCPCTLLITKGEMPTDQSHISTAVSLLHSGLQRVGGRDKHSVTDYVSKASRDLGLAPWTRQLKSGLPRYLADSGDWAVRLRVFLLQVEHRLHHQPDGNVLQLMFTVWVFMQIHTTQLSTECKLYRPTFHFWLLWLHPWLPW